jgi:hypothetical protein
MTIKPILPCKVDVITVMGNGIAQQHMSMALKAYWFDWLISIGME